MHNLSCGRVQTPTVAMIAAREDEIQELQTQTYYGIEARTDQKLKLTWQDVSRMIVGHFDKEKSIK